MVRTQQRAGPSARRHRILAGRLTIAAVLTLVTCVGWRSIGAAEPRGTWSARPTAPALFTKLGPANNLTGLGANTRLTWGRAARADYYQICVDQTNNNRCDTAWRPGAQSTVLTLENLRAGTYYWQVRALVGGKLVEADDGEWWRFAVGGGAVAKLAPASGTAGLGRTVELTWGRLVGADYYQICVDQTNNDSCDTAWRPGAQSTVLTLENLRTGTYYWQVRALVNGTLMYADGGRWWSFRVATRDPAPPAPWRPVPSWRTASG